MSNEAITRNDLKAILNEIIPSFPMVDIFYPVGSYYETSDINFDPNITWGGTWLLETEGQVHISGGLTYEVDAASADRDNNDGTVGRSQGGEAEHTLTKNELPKVHGHAQFRAYRTSSSGTKAALIFSPTGAFSTEETTSTGNGIQVTTASGLGTYFLKMDFGNDEAHNNMQPYIAVNRWHRIA